ncbi:prolyl oligopeptidase family serine peptidase [Silvibacterium acidisoli]|uniref:prolyl oligopeptidase family serine peptidase n=1 Tax=Acidobacteriaceae bacterium ZG23-2 TaxID=2883246 RepID=UPI00406D18EC
MFRYESLSALLMLALLPASAIAQTPATSPHPMTIDDVFRLKDLADPQISPDGQWVAYTLSSIDVKEDKRVTDLWMVKWDASEDVQLTYNRESSASAPRWSPDGKYLSFESDRAGEAKGTQVWVLDRRGGEARQFTDVKGHLGSYAWSPDGKKLLLDIRADEDADKKDEKDKKEEKPKPIVIDRYKFKQDVQGYLTGNNRSLLYLYDVATKKLDKLTNDSAHDEMNAAWSPDGSKIAFVSNHDTDWERTINTDVFVVDAAPNSAPRKLTNFNGEDGGRLAWSPDSKWIAYTQGSDPKFEEYSQNDLTIVGLDGSAPRILTTKLDRNVSSPLFSADGKSVTVLVTDDRSEYPASVDVATGDTRRLIEQPGVITTQARLAGHDVLLRSTDADPANLFAYENGGLRKLTTHNDALLAELQLGTTRDLEATSKDGTKVHALLTLPPDAVAGKKYPMLLRIHGGPNGQDAHSFTPERQVFAGHGYAVLNVNYRGGAGRGHAYQQVIFADWGNHEVVDLLAAVDEAVKEGYADPDHLGVGGWSYGGILTDYTIASTNRFKAAISGAGVGNPVALYGVDQYIHQYDTELQPPWKAPETYIKLGYPLYHADRIHTPTLFMGGDKDFNVPLVGGEQMYEALRSLNVPAELIIYPGQFHGFTRPSFIRDRYQRYLAWYDKWVLAPNPPAAAVR